MPNEGFVSKLNSKIKLNNEPKKSARETTKELTLSSS
jgi:hypothetical protein